jgi:ABC-type uncharacterized transport system permease subunit
MSVDTAPVTSAEPDAKPGEPATSRARGDSWLVTLLAIVMALFIGGLLMAFSDATVRTELGYFFQHPTDSVRDSWYTMRDAYKALFQGAIFDFDNDGTADGIFGPIASTIFTAGPLICAGLGITVAFRSGLFNIGGQGQVTVGAVASGYVGFAISLPPFIHVVAAVIAGVIAGGLWGLIAGALKARTGAHEVITTIMLNYVAVYGLLFVLGLKDVQNPTDPQSSKFIPGSARLPHLFGGGLPLDAGIILALASAGAVWWLLSRSTLGFRLRAVGLNPAAAQTAGMNVSNATMIAMALAGALAGLGGTLLALGGATSYQITPGVDSNVGFDAITVALLGRTNPWGTVGAGLLLGALRAGAPTMTAQANVSGDIVTVIQALIVMFVAAPRLVRAVFRLKGRGSGVHGVSTSLAVTVSAVRTAQYPRHLVSGVSQIVLGVLGLIVFGLGSRSKHQSHFEFSLPGSRFDIGGATFTARPVVAVLALVVVAAGVLRLTQRLAARWCVSIAIFGLLLAFMVWSVAGSPTGMNVVSLLQGALFPAAIPLILGAMAGVIGERSGVVNVALEAQLLLGAFVAAFVASLAHNIWVGLIGAALAGMLVAGLLSVLAIRYLVDQVIIGVVLNVFVLGTTNFLFNQVISQNQAADNSPGYFKVWKIPGLGDIPILGPVLFDGTIFLYATYVIVAMVHYGLFHTRWGLRVRAVGEHPRAADTVGIKVNRTRYRAVLLAGVIAGLAGAFLVMGEGSAGTFATNMSSGKGYIALAAVIFGRWTPRGAVLAALLFGFADQLQSLLSQADSPISPNLLLTLPYVATLFAVAGFVGRVRAPAADGQPYSVGS